MTCNAPWPLPITSNVELAHWPTCELEAGHDGPHEAETGYLDGFHRRTWPGTTAACYDCGRRYGDEYGFPDLVVPHGVWQKISPKGHEGGLLCPSCMCKRAYDAGLRDIPAYFASGPFAACTSAVAEGKAAP